MMNDYNDECERKQKKMRATGIVVESKESVIRAIEVKIPIVVFEAAGIEVDSKLEIFIDTTDGRKGIILKPY